MFSPGCGSGRQCNCSKSRSEEHTSELQSQSNLVCRLLLEKKKHAPRTISPTPASNDCPSVRCSPADVGIRTQTLRTKPQAIRTPRPFEPLRRTTPCLASKH